MPNPRLTQARVDALKPGKSARNIRNGALRGFGIRIMPSGGKRFFIHSQHDGHRVWKVVGDADIISL